MILYYAGTNFLQNTLNMIQIFGAYIFVIKILKRFFKSSHREVFYRKAVLKISQNSQENFCRGVQLPRPTTLIKTELHCRYFHMNFADFRNIFLGVNMQNFPKKNISYPLIGTTRALMLRAIMHPCVFVSAGKKCKFFRKFCVRTK